MRVRICTHVTAKENVDATLFKNRSKVLERGSLHGPILVNNGDNPRSYLSVNSGEVLGHKCKLVCKEGLVNCIDVGLCRKDNEVSDALVEGIVDVVVCSSIGASEEGNAVETRAIFGKVALGVWVDG